MAGKIKNIFCGQFNCFESEELKKNTAALNIMHRGSIKADKEVY